MMNFDELLQVLQNDEQPFVADVIYGLSDLTDESVQRLGSVWGAIPADRRLSLVNRLNEAAETNFDMDFSAVARLAMTDLNDDVRAAAVDAAWMDDSPAMLQRLMSLASADLSENVRASAASALGKYILQGELGQLAPDLARRAENTALKLYNNANESVAVRRRALEAIANCGREGVNEMIDEAYRDDDPQMRYSAVFAMGRSCDPKWAEVVLRELSSSNPEMRFEATRTAGELELKAAIPQLGRLLEDNDREIVEMAIWSLGEIGGTQAQRLIEDMLELADDAGDDALVEALEEALGAASLAGEDLVF